MQCNINQCMQNQQSRSIQYYRSKDQVSSNNVYQNINTQEIVLDQIYDSNQNQQKIQYPIKIQQQTHTKITLHANLIRSPHRQQYQDYFIDLQQQANFIINQRLKDKTSQLQHKIVLLNHNKEIQDLISFQKPTVYIMGHLYGGVIIKYQIIIGNYKISLDLLNLNIKSTLGLEEIGNGSYGRIYKITYDQKKAIVAKRMKFHFKVEISVNQSIEANKFQIQEAICEYALYKICSFYKIGPKVINKFGFDLVCFEDGIQFYLEYCQNIIASYKNLEKQLNLAVCILHKLKIIHKDIKPSNLLYSEEYQRFVLCDFGISHPVSQDPGYLSKTFQEGSFGFMCQQMHKMRKGVSDYVDLYYNDLHGLRVSLLEFKSYEKSMDTQIKYQSQVYLKSKRKQKNNNLYPTIHFFYQIINSHKQELSQVMVYFIEVKVKEMKLFFASIINEQIKKLIDQKFTEQIRNRFYSIIKNSGQNNKQKEENQKVYYFIRCYGMSQMLYDQLNTLKKTDFVSKIQIKIRGNNSKKDLTFWQNLNKLKKINPLKSKLQREIRQLQQISNIQQSTQLLELYYKLLFLKFNESQVLVLQLNNIFDKIQEAYVNNKQEDERYQFAKLLLNMTNNDKGNDRELNKFINKFPQKQSQLYQILYKIHENTSKAVEYAEKYIACIRKKGINHSQIYHQEFFLEILNCLVFYYFNNKRTHFKKFQQIFQWFQTIIKSIHSKNIQESSTGDIYKYLGNIQLIKSNFQKGIEYLTMSQIRQRQLNGEISIRRGNALNVLAKSLFIVNQYEKAAENFKIALEIYKIYANNFKQYFRQIDSCYYYLCLIYLIQNNLQKFKYYLNFQIYYDIQVRDQLLLNGAYKQNSELLRIDTTNFQLSLKNIMVKIRNSHISSTEFCQKYDSVFYYSYHYLEKQTKKLKAFWRYKNQSNLMLLQELQTKWKVLLNYLLEIFQRLVQSFLQIHTYRICCFKKALQMDGISMKIKLKDQILEKLYEHIQFYYTSHKQLQLSYLYARKQFIIIKSKNIINEEFIIFTKKLSFKSLYLQKYQQCIYYQHLLLSHKLKLNQISISELYGNVIASFLKIGKRKKAQLYQIYYLKYCTQWSLHSYNKMMQTYNLIKKLDSFIIFKCYLETFMKISTADHQINKNINIEVFKKNYEICKNIFNEKQVLETDEIFTAIKLSKMCLFIKKNIKCLKYFKNKSIKRFITQKLNQLL